MFLDWINKKLHTERKEISEADFEIWRICWVIVPFFGPNSDNGQLFIRSKKLRESEESNPTTQGLKVVFGGTQGQLFFFLCITNFNFLIFFVGFKTFLMT
jgi:hypothetical protein